MPHSFPTRRSSDLSVALSLATLSTTLLLSLAANAHDPKAFDQMMEAAPAATVSACDELEVKQQEGASADTDIKDLKARCDAEKKAENASDSGHRSEEHTSELQSLMRISYAVFCLKKK